MDCIGIFHFGLLKILSEGDEKQPRDNFFFSFTVNSLPEEVLFYVKSRFFTIPRWVKRVLYGCNRF